MPLLPASITAWTNSRFTTYGEPCASICRRSGFAARSRSAASTTSCLASRVYTTRMIILRSAKLRSKPGRLSCWKSSAASEKWHPCDPVAPTRNARARKHQCGNPLPRTDRPRHPHPPRPASAPGFRTRRALWGEHQALQRAGSPQPQALSGRFHVSAHRRGDQFFKVAICDLKDRPRPASQVLALRLHRTWRDHGRHDSQQPARHRNERLRGAQRPHAYPSLTPKLLAVALNHVSLIDPHLPVVTVGFAALLHAS